MSSKKLQISKNTAQTAKRLLKYVTETYKLRFFLVFICIFISSGASISVSLSLKFLLDDFIIPLIGQQTPDFAGCTGAGNAGLYFRCGRTCRLYLYKTDGLYRTGCVKTDP